MVTRLASGGGNLYSRVGHAMCWRKSLEWKSRKAEGVEIFLAWTDGCGMQLLVGGVLIKGTPVQVGSAPLVV